MEISLSSDTITVADTATAKRPDALRTSALDASVRKPGYRVLTSRGGEKQIHRLDASLHPQPEGQGWRVASNVVTTSRYHWWNFLPMNLFEQFQNAANIYFLFIGILQIIPVISTTNGNPTMYQTLGFIVFVSAARAATEDRLKHKADDQRNNSNYQVLEPQTNGSFQFVDKASGDVQVGDIIKIRKDETIPADLLFLASSEDKGYCYIDKANLNGETALERLDSLRETREYCKTDMSMGRMSLEVTFEPPNSVFDELRGTLRIDNCETLPLDGKLLLMRETNLRNVAFIVGLVLYTGNDTKIQQASLKSGRPKEKRSKISRKVNRYLVVMLLCQLLLCITGGIICAVFYNDVRGDTWYLDADALSTSSALLGLYAAFSWMILLAQMVPISLIVSSEMVKFTQSRFIQADLQLYYEPIDKPCKVNRSTIHEDLGVVDYIFSDKTGTLTQNKMQLRYLGLPAVGQDAEEKEKADVNAEFGSIEFGSQETQISRAVQIRQSELAAATSNKKTPSPQLWTRLEAPLHSKGEHKPSFFARHLLQSTKFYQPGFDGSQESTNAQEFNAAEAEQLQTALWGTASSAQLKQQLRMYMIHMAISNTVRPDDATGTLKFQSESAEELAMCTFAMQQGFTKTKVNPTTLQIQEKSGDLRELRTVVEKYEHMATLAFTSKRARVTVVYHSLTDGHVYIMSKGADSTMLPLIHWPGLSGPRANAASDALRSKLSDLANNGLRTLVVASGKQSSDWWLKPTKGRALSFADEFLKIAKADTTEASTGHSDGRCKRAEGGCELCAQERFYDALEAAAQLEYIGCVGLEDQLQLLVPETIQDLLRAGIKVWMITGDKLETAKNIGLATNLIGPDMQVLPTGDDSMEAICDKYKQARLIEITGRWAALAQDAEELGSLFDLFDDDKNGFMDAQEFNFCLNALSFPHYSDDPSNKLQQEFKRIGKGDKVDKAGWLQIIANCNVSFREAVRWDIENGWRVYNSITDHVRYPVSMVITRDAFLVLFPPDLPAAKKASTATRSSASVSPTHQAATQAAAQASNDQLEELRSRFFGLAALAKSVIFARAQPDMKKRMVTEIMARVPGCTALAVGDGANDADMITAAHVGVGIAGVEGTAAVNSADYAIGTFRMLHTLILVHGFWNYHRISSLVCFIFYKAALVALTGYYFGIFSGFSGSQFFIDAPLQLYNVMFTALPILFLAVFDQILPRSTLHNTPEVYLHSKGRAFNSLVYLSWILRAVVHSVIIFFVPYACFIYQSQSLNHDADPTDLSVGSTTVYYATVLLPTFVILAEMRSVNFFALLGIFLSVSSLVLVTVIMSAPLLRRVVPSFTGVIFEMFSYPKFWFVLIVTLSTPILLEVACRYVRDMYFPAFYTLLRERLRLLRVAAVAEVHQRMATLHETELQAVSRTPDPASLAVYSTNESKNWVLHASESTLGGSQIQSLDEVKSTESVTRGQPIRRKSSADPRDSSESEKRMRIGVARALVRFWKTTGAQFQSTAAPRNQSLDSFRQYAFSPSLGAQPAPQRYLPSAAIGDSQTSQASMAALSSSSSSSSSSSPHTASVASSPLAVSLASSSHAPTSPRAAAASSPHAPASPHAASVSSSSHAPASPTVTITRTTGVSGGTPKPTAAAAPSPVSSDTIGGMVSTSSRRSKP